MTADALAAHPFTKPFWPDHLARLSHMASEVHFAPGELIFHEGDRSSLFYLLISGSVAIEVQSPGRTVRVDTLYGGEVLGWSSVTAENSKHFQARALEPVDAIALDGARLRRACSEDYAFGFEFLSALTDVMSSRLRALRTQLLDAYTPVRAQ